MEAARVLSCLLSASLPIVSFTHSALLCVSSTTKSSWYLCPFDGSRIRGCGHGASKSELTGSDAAGVTITPEFVTCRGQPTYSRHVARTDSRGDCGARLKLTGRLGPREWS